MDMRRSHVIVVAALIGGLTTGCAQRVMNESQGDVALPEVSESWGSTFRAGEGWNNTKGSVFARPMGGGTQVTLTVEGGIAGSRYGWDLREGACGSTGRLLGDVNAFQPVILGDRGVGNSIAQVAVPLEASQQYSVNLYADPSERTIRIGCGMLTR